MGSRRAWVPTVLVAVVAVVLAVVGYVVGHHYKTDDAKQAASDTPTTPAAVLGATSAPSAAASSAAPTPAAAAVAAALREAATDPALGQRLLGAVTDTDGTVLYDSDAGTAAPPASTAKLLTAVAAISALHPDGRITTRVVAGSAPGQIVLVGGGDPTLTAATTATATPYPGAARLADLAAAVQRAKINVTSIVVDDSRFSGPAVSPEWASEDVPSDYASAITAVMADGGRAHPGDFIRSDQPDVAAGQSLATLLGADDAEVTTGTAPTGARTLGSVQSAPIATLVTQMLQESDNVIAECLGRLVALAEKQPASFTGAVAGIRAALAKLGVDEPAGMQDASGLAPSDRLSPGLLTAVLRLIAGGKYGDLHEIVAALPVAAWSGTLEDRYVSGEPAAAGAGVVRAKTGTLTGVSSLAGFVHDADGRLLIFAFIADQADSSFDAEHALDVLAATLAGCGCR